MKGMARFAEQTFGEYGGIAQQYLFYYITHCKDVNKRQVRAGLHASG